MTFDCATAKHYFCEDEHCQCLCHGDRPFAQPIPRTFLSPQQSRVAAMVGSGFGIKIIADELETTPQTVKNILGVIYRKLDISPSHYRICAIVKLAVWWNCELFQKGLSA